MKVKVGDETFKEKDSGCTVLPPHPQYGSVWMNTDTRIIKALNVDGEWVTHKETDDPTLKEILSVWVDFPIDVFKGE